VAAAAARLTPPTDIPLKDPRHWKIAGKSIARLDTAEKLNCIQINGMDLRLPGMLNAAIHACPVFGGKIGAIDSKAAEAGAGNSCTI
jgi:isoquinoline 1-oxidoreductase beta subunit